MWCADISNAKAYTLRIPFSHKNTINTKSVMPGRILKDHVKGQALDLLLWDYRSVFFTFFQLSGSASF